MNIHLKTSILTAPVTEEQKQAETANEETQRTEQGFILKRSSLADIAEANKIRPKVERITAGTCYIIEQ